jgi:hypothetical protein
MNCHVILFWGKSLCLWIAKFWSKLKHVDFGDRGECHRFIHKVRVTRRKEEKTDVAATVETRRHRWQRQGHTEVSAEEPCGKPAEEVEELAIKGNTLVRSTGTSRGCSWEVQSAAWAMYGLHIFFHAQPHSSSMAPCHHRDPHIHDPH